MFGFFRNKITIFIFSVLLVLFIWQAAYIITDSELIIPSPKNVLKSFLSLTQNAEFYTAVRATIIRALTAFIIAFFSALILGLLSGFYKFIYSLLFPFISIIKTVPFMSIILLALIWFESDIVPVFACFLVIFPVVYSNVYEGMRNVDSSLVEMAHLYNKSPREIVCHVYLPSILPFTLASISSGLGIAWKIIIAAEVLSEPAHAIGSGLQNARLNLDTAEVFAWTLVAVFLSIITELLSMALLSKYSWRQNGD